MPVTNISQVAPQGMNPSDGAARRGGKPGSGSSSGGGKPGGNADKSLGLTDHYYGDGQMPRAQPGGKPGMATNAQMTQGAPPANKGMMQAPRRGGQMPPPGGGFPNATPTSATYGGRIPMGMSDQMGKRAPSVPYKMYKDNPNNMRNVYAPKPPPYKPPVSKAPQQERKVV